MSIKKISLDMVIAKYNELGNKAKTQGTKQMLKNIHETSQKITSSGGTVSPSAIITILSSKGIIIAPRTLYYNKKEVDKKVTNPYRILVDAWIEHSITVNAVNLSSKDLKASIPESFVDESDLAKIEDLTLKHKMALLLGEVKGLRNQVNTLREIRTNPTLSLSKPLAELSYEESMELTLDEYEIDLLKELIKVSKSSYVGFSEAGELIALKAINRDEILSDPGLKDTIEKIVNLHTPPSL
jgi:hypothetical protein